MAREASGKYAMSRAPATLSSSSSASSKLNWQPSQEANLKTASRGLRLILELFFFQERPHPVIGKDGAVLANEVRAILTVSAETDRALHVSFHGKINILPGESVSFQIAGNKPHHDLGSAGEG